MKLCCSIFSLEVRPNFFGAFQSSETARQELRRRFSANESVVVEKSDRIITGRFDLLGLKDLDFGTPINWHLEPTAGTVAPLVHWSQIDYLDTNLTGDKKITWELNRHQYFATLGRAYWFTNDERYAETFASHLQSWIDQNPPKLGINWASSLEVGYRAISWLWAINFFKGSAGADAFVIRAAFEIALPARAASGKLPLDVFQPEHTSHRRSTRSVLSRHHASRVQ